MSRSAPRSSATAFPGVLMAPGAPPAADRPAELPLFGDVNLDQVFDAVLAGRDQYDLREFCYRPLGDRAAIEYRHDVFRDLDGTPLADHVRAFGRQLLAMRQHLGFAGKHGYDHERKRWFLAAAADYCAAVTELTGQLGKDRSSSAGIAGLRAFLADYTASPEFTALHADVRAVSQGLAELRYCIDIKGDRVRVGYFHDEPDYSRDVAATFEKFRQGAVKSYRVKFSDHRELDHIEGQILARVARLFPDQFGALDRFRTEHESFAHPDVLAADRELQFYLAWLDYLAPLRAAGLAISYPVVSADRKAERATATYDLALAAKLVRSGDPVVTNDYHLDGPERIIVVSGPNQGGKTTFARTFGQLHYLAKLGLPVAGTDVALALGDRVFTHFERPENLHDLIGKLHDDLVRMQAIFDEATPRSVVILNEIFTSTTLQDAMFLSQQILSRLAELDVLCVCVTFLDELSRLGPSVVSMVSTVRSDDPATRTFKLVREVADGRAYALAIADRYGLTYDRLKSRLANGGEVAAGAAVDGEAP